MSILAECPGCHRKQTLRNKKCPSCGEDLDKAKKSKRVRHWVFFRMPDKTQRMEAVGSFEGLDPYSIEDAKTADSKRKVQKKERRLLDIKKECTMTFNQLKEWYLDLEKTKSLAAYQTVCNSLKKFCGEFGNRIVNTVRPSELENLQAKRQKKGLKAATVDREFIDAKVMVNKAFKDDLVSGETLKVFKGIKLLLKPNANARSRILGRDEFDRIVRNLPYSGQGPFQMAFWTGMRKSEVINLTWDRIDLEKHLIKLEAKDTKDREPRSIPISDDLLTILKRIPRSIHDPHVFLSKGKTISRDLLEQWLKKACLVAEVLYGRDIQGGFIWHDLRHGFVTYMRKAGVDKSVIMEITGHSTDAMFHRYNEVDEDDRVKAINRFENFMRDFPENANQSANQKI